MAASTGSLYTTSQDSFERARNRCLCGEPAAIRMSWKVLTFGRRFLNCSKMQLEQCSFFRWVDGPTCQRGCEVDQKVQEKINKLEDKIKELKLKETHLHMECESHRKMEAKLSDELKILNKRERILLRVLIMSWVFFYGCCSLVWCTCKVSILRSLFLFTLNNMCIQEQKKFVLLCIMFCIKGMAGLLKNDKIQPLPLYISTLYSCI